MTSVLAPLAARYAWWLALPDEQTSMSDASPDQVWAMPVVLRLEKSQPPSRTPLLEAAATAALAVCLDERSAAGGPWHDAVHTWISGHIRKVARRARGAHWRAVQDLPGVTVDVAGAQARALLPCRVSDLPREVSRLQVSGSDLPPDEPEPPPADVPLLLLNPHVTMTVGKAAAQVGHATMLLAALLDEPGLAWWRDRGYRCAVRMSSVAEWAGKRRCDPVEAWREHRLVAVRDAGFTEIAPGTVTVLAQWRAGHTAAADR